MQEVVAGSIDASYTTASGPGIVGGSLGVKHIAIVPRDSSDFSLLRVKARLCLSERSHNC